MASPSLSSTDCTFSGWNETTGCYVLRSCASCLETDHCMIDSSGTCTSAALPDIKELYTYASDDNLTLPGLKDRNETMQGKKQTWGFPSSRATYCPADDAVCKRCIQERFWVPQGGWVDSRFCLGADDCVCVMNCEFGEHVPPCEVPTVGPTVVRSDPSWAECQYSFQDNATGCTTRRSCSECVQKAGCRISEDGFCEPAYTRLSEYTLARDYTGAYRANLVLPTALETNPTALQDRQRWFFDATTTTYCSVTDPICARCIQEKFWLRTGQAEDSRFCVGADNCVCVANCDPELILSECPPPRETRKSEFDAIDGIGGYLTFLLVVGIAAALFVLCCLCSLCGKLAGKQRERDLQTGQQQQRSVLASLTSDDDPLVTTFQAAPTRSA